MYAGFFFEKEIAVSKFTKKWTDFCSSIDRFYLKINKNKEDKFKKILKNCKKIMHFNFWLKKLDLICFF